MRLFDYWSDCPPLHLMVANFLGYKKRRRAAPDMMEVQKALGTLPGHRRGKSLDRAPLRIQAMAAAAKKAAEEKVNG